MLAALDLKIQTDPLKSSRHEYINKLRKERTIMDEPSAFDEFRKSGVTVQRLQVWFHCRIFTGTTVVFWGAFSGYLQLLQSFHGSHGKIYSLLSQPVCSGRITAVISSSSMLKAWIIVVEPNAALNRSSTSSLSCLLGSLVSLMLLVL